MTILRIEKIEMFLRVELTFEDTLPSPSLFLSELRKSTGLEDLSLREDARKLIHPLFPDSDFYFSGFESGKTSIIIWTTVAKIGYLMEASIFVFQKLGGKSNDVVNPLAKLKWVEVKDSYKPKDVLSDEDIDWLDKNIPH